MKSISKVLSLFLVVVMCFGLFSTSALATSTANFDFGGNSAGNNSTEGGWFDFNPSGSSGNSTAQPAGNGGFDFEEQQSQPASFEPQQAASTSSDSNTTVTNSLSFGDNAVFDAPKPAGETWKFVSDKSLINKSMSDDEAKIVITCPEHGTGFNSDTFDAGFGYSTKSNGSDMVKLTNGVDYTIEPGKLTIYGSRVKALAIGSYYIFGLSTSDVPNQMVYITINSGDFGSFNIGNSPYNKNAVSPAEVFADSTSSKMDLFSGFGVVGVTDSSFTKQLTLNTDYYTSGSRYVYLKTSFLNTLADGTYKLIGFTTPSDINKDQVVIGNFAVETGALDASYVIVTGSSGHYDKSKPMSGENFVTAEAQDPASEEWLLKFTYKVTNGSYVHELQSGEYSIGNWGSTYNGLALGESYLNSLPDGKYTIIGTATLSTGTVETTLGSFTVTSGSVNFGAFVVGNSPYDKSSSSRKAIVALATDTADVATAAVNMVTGVSIEGPENRTLTYDSEYYKTTSGAQKFVAIRPEVLDTLPDGTYNLILTSASGSISAQRTIGHFIVTSGDLSEVFSIVNNPYDKSDENRKAVAALAGGNHPLNAVNSVTGVAISGTESKTLASSEYYKVTNNQYYVAIRPEVLDTLPEGTYNFILTVKTGAASTQINAGQFTVKASAVDAEFTIANSPYDKNSTDSKAVGAVPKTTGVIANITGVAISGTESRTLASSEYYKQADNGTNPGYVVILKDVLNTLPDGTYNFLVTISTGTSSVQKNAGQFVVKASPVDFGQFEITGTPFDKNADAPAAVVATAKENGKDPVLHDFSIAGVGSMSAPLVLKSSDYSYTEGTDSSPRTLELKAAFVKTLADGDYYIYAQAKSGVSATQGTIGMFTVKTGKIPFGTFTMNPDTYDKNAEKPTEVVATESNTPDMEKFTGFAVSTVGGSFTSTRTLSSSEYKKTDTSVTILASVLGTLPDGEYKLLGTATVGTTTEQVPIGIFYVKSGDVVFGTYAITPASFNKNDANRADLSVKRTEKADPRFTPNSFSIAGLTNTSFSRILSVNEYTINDPTTEVKDGWLTLKKNVLDTLPDGNYKLVCSATVGNVSGQVDLGTFTVVSGEVNYGSYAIHKSPYDKNNSSSEAIFSEETHGWAMLQYFNGFAISGVTDTSFNQVLIGSQYSVNSSQTKVTISKDVLNALPDGDYNLLGFATIGQASSQVNMGMFTVTSNYGAFHVYNSPYDKNAKNAQPVYVTAEKYADMQKMNGFGVASVSGSYAQPLSVNSYYISSDGKSIVLEESYLDTLADGQYYLIGFPRLGSTKEQVILGTFIVKSGGITGNAMLTPDGQVWYSGSDPLTFYSEIHDLAGKGWNYKSYDWGNIVPDVRYSTYSDMRSPTSVRIDQYWDLNYGYIMLGANFLSSLSAEHTYYLQVVDARDPEGLYSNVVSFRVGPTLRAIDTDKHVINSTRSLRFRSSEPVSRVYVGNIELTDPADFGVSWDGRTVTLSFEFLNKRSPGNTYTIKVLTTGGEYASTTFQVLTTAQGSASPRTGDESNLGLWAAFLLLSGTAVVVLVPKLKKQDF